jgi:WD40 repeat protein
VAGVVKSGDHEEIEIRDAPSGSVVAVYVAEDGFRSMAGIEPPQSFNWGPGEMAWSPDGRRLAIPIYADDQVGIDVWDVLDERRVARWSHERNRDLKGHADAGIGSPIWSPNGKYVAVEGIGDGSRLHWTAHLHVIDAATGRRVLKHAFAKINREGGSISAHAWTDDGLNIALGTREGYLQLVHVESGRCVISSKAHDAPIAGIACKP